MSSDPSPQRGGANSVRTVNPWIVVATVSLASFMDALDTTIANGSLRYIAGDLGVSVDDASWLMTSFLAAYAVVLPASGWASGLIGRKRFYLGCILLFTVGSALCGLAPNLTVLLLCRVLQGAAAGGLQPSEQSILLDTFPGKQRGMAMAVYGVAILVAPILGPTLGGYITEYWDWRWIFFINIPVGCLSLFLTHLVVQDPPYMEEERKAKKGKPLQLDFFGLGLIALGLGALEVVYDRGQEDDWVNSRFILMLMVLAVVSLSTAVVWELRHPRPIVNLRLLKDRSFAGGCVVIYLVFAVLYGSNVLLPQMLQDVFSHDAFKAGLIMSPGGIAVMVCMLISGGLLARFIDGRYLIFIGVLSIWATNDWTSRLTLDVSPWGVAAPRCVQLAVVGFLFAPGNTAPYTFLPREQFTNATALFNMVRNQGTSLGVAVFTILLARRSQFHQDRFVEGVDRLGWPFDDIRHQQAQSLACFDLFWLLSMAALFAAPLVLLMRRSVLDNRAAAEGR